MATQNASTQVTRRQMVKGFGITIAGLGTGALAPTLIGIGPGVRIGVPKAYAAGPVKLPIGWAITHEIHQALEVLAVSGSLVTLAAFNAEVMARTGIQFMVEGFAAESASVRVTKIAAGFAVTTLAMVKIGFAIWAGYVVWQMIQGIYRPQAGEINFEFVPEADWWATYPNGDMAGIYLPGPPHNLPQAAQDVRQYLMMHPGLCSGLLGPPGQGSCFSGGFFAVQDSPPLLMEHLPGGEVILHPIYIEQ